MFKSVIPFKFFGIVSVQMEVDLGKLHAERAQRLAAQTRMPKAADGASTQNTSSALPDSPMLAAAASGNAGVLTSRVREVRFLMFYGMVANSDSCTGCLHDGPHVFRILIARCA